MIGQQIGKYRVIAKVGEGGMGAVYEAVNEQIGKRVAIKVLHKDHAKNPQIASRFVNEARAINVVDHPGVVQVSEWDAMPDGTAYIVMELLKGETLNARMKSGGGRMPMMSALPLARQIASALAAAHAKGIIHRDLKPDNIMLVPDPAMPGGERSKLLDFGIAKLKLEYQGSGDQVMTRAGVMMGTPLYMSPEQCRNASDVDDKADVYSLGVMLYRMLAGKPPFQAPGTGELMAMHIYMQPPNLGELDRTLPEPLVQLVHRMLAKKREERPSMAQVAQELERIGLKASGMMPVVPGPSASPAALAPATPVNEGATVVSDSMKPGPAPTAPTAAAPAKSRLTLGLILMFVILAGAFATLVALKVINVPALSRNGNKPSPTDPKGTGTQPETPKTDNPTGTDKPPTKATLIRWHIESDPPGADIYRTDTNENLGSTPYRSEQPSEAKQIDLELRLKGYQTSKLTLSGEKDAEPPTVKLDAEKKGKKPRKPAGGKAPPAKMTPVD